jgi:hypothetical protein
MQRSVVQMAFSPVPPCQRLYISYKIQSRGNLTTMSAREKCAISSLVSPIIMPADPSTTASFLTDQYIPVTTATASFQNCPDPFSTSPPMPDSSMPSVQLSPMNEDLKSPLSSDREPGALGHGIPCGHHRQQCTTTHTVACLLGTLFFDSLPCLHDLLVGQINHPCLI